MIASLAGTVARSGLDSVVLDVGGVGMLVHTTPRTAATLRTGTTARLATSLVVREDSLTLYGFAEDEERELFELVQTVSGVGPRLALAMLSVHAPDAVRTALSTGDLVTLTKVPGLGRKGAERLVLELRDKVAAAPVGAAVATDEAVDAGWKTQVGGALVGLGWTAKQAEDAVEKVSPQAGDDTSVAALLRAALQVLGR